MDVLDQGVAKKLFVTGVAQHDGDDRKTGGLGGPQPTLTAQRAQSQAMQQNMMLYFMPVLYGVITYSLPAAAGLYFGVGNLISLGQEFLIKRQLQKQN